VILRIRRTLAKTIGAAKLEPFGINEKRWEWNDSDGIDLSELVPKKLTALDKLLAAYDTAHGVGVLRKDIATWKAAISDAAGQKPRTVQQFEGLATRFLEPLPHHHVYHRRAEGVWQPYYVNRVEYEPERRDHGSYHPAYVFIELLWEEFGGRKKTTWSFYESDVRGFTVREAFARKDLYVETAELRAAHLKTVERFSSLVPKIGAQFYAGGTATDDIDGTSSWRHSTFTMERDGEPSRVVLDVFFEDDKEHNSKDVHADTWFWPNHRVKKKDEDSEEIDGDSGETAPELEIPIHPMLAVFDLARHLRLRIHVSHLTEYVYKPDMATKLVLPREMKDLVQLLCTHQAAAFQDIIKGKSGGVVVLLGGAPGTGKTLTAEIYAEATQRALYSVQCSQLGTSPTALEEQLGLVFARATRWNAVLLLDEADVYVHKRGNDLQQNAIVGVFLRVLEYQDALLFFTTNRPADVDDAIASRCVARLTYPVPSPADQCAIWRILADGSKTALADETIVEIVRRNPRLTGRDVKNLLKLARLVTPPITADTIDFVKRFKPTEDV